jgi:hypothetical protein
VCAGYYRELYALYRGQGNNSGSMLKSGSSFAVVVERICDSWGYPRTR